jgi:REP element-mobilizing transposase RayT
MAERETRGPLNPDRIVDPKSLPRVEPQWRGDLPHLYKTGCTYFVTFCLADAVPGQVIRKTVVEEDLEPEEIARHFDIDPSFGSRILKQPEAAGIVESSILHFQGDRYALSAWSVMPNHVHAVVTPYADHTLSGIPHSWKSFSAHEINRELKKRGKLWEKESFDHLVRSEQAFAKFVRYTEENPVVAGLCGLPEEWTYSSARFRRQRE